MGAMLLLAPAHAAKMSPAQYQEATQSLQHGAEWVPGGGGHYFWRAHAAMATPPAAGESWYLHTGPGLLPADLLEQIMTPDGTPATQSPDSAQLLNYKGSGGVTWPDHAHGHLLYPRVFALAPPSCKRAVLWNPETSKLDDVSAPSECTASAPGHGYLNVQAPSFECLARSPKPFPLLILLEVQCLAGLLPDPTGKGPREALQPAIAGMVRKRDDDDATPLFSWFCLIVKLETRARRTGRGVVFFVFSFFMPHGDVRPRGERSEAAGNRSDRHTTSRICVVTRTLCVRV